MEEALLESIEFDQVLEQLAHHAQSEVGKKRALALRPLCDPEACEHLQESTQGALDLLLAFSNPPLFGIHATRASIKRACLGGVLSMGQLLEISEGLRVARELINYVRDAEEGPFVARIRGLFTQKGLEEAISDAIEAEGVMKDSASPALLRIRRSQKSKQDQVKNKLNAIMLQAGAAGHLSENLVTMREGRYVLPVKAKSRASFHGLVHDQSASGATLFMEPAAVVELNNEIRALALEERDEIQRILADFSAQVADFSEELIENEQALIEIDFTFAKAQYALEIGGSRPSFTRDRTIDLKQARHPLLGKQVVPIDFRLGDDFNTMIITGPNTGGKTVTLKTIGLMQCMAQSGLQIPCKSNGKVGVFQEIYADIGDKQSIALSLSTFSASMKNIVSILDKADASSLLLFDELGSGTDPIEGAALAMAILERVTKDEIRTVATTHYSELKLFAIRSPRVQNASVEFDVETLSPTYKLLIGLPGRSNAFEITKRLGMSEDLLADAAKRVDQESVQFEDVLRDMENARKELERDRLLMKEQKAAFEAEQDQKKAQWDRKLQQEEERLAKEKEEARSLLVEAQNQAQEILRQAKKASRSAGGVQKLDRTLSDVNEKARMLSQRLSSDRTQQSRLERRGTSDERLSVEGLKKGDRVRILSLDETGVLVSNPDKNGEVQVQMGILKVQAALSDLRRLQETQEESIQKSQVVVHRSQGRGLSFELDLRGERYEQALTLLDRYLDDAVLEGFEKVRIIHGKGTGALRKGVQEALSKDRRVRHFDFAKPENGGSGVTEVELK